MRRELFAGALACCALLAAGCGGSESGSGASSTASTAKSTAASTATSTAKTSAAGVPSSGVKVDTTPKFASPSTSAPVQSGTIQIAYRNIAIAPDTVRAKVGSTIRWINEDPQKCNVSSVGGAYTFKSPDFGEGGSYELHLTKPGTIHYECTYYPVTMNGTIEVVG